MRARDTIRYDTKEEEEEKKIDILNISCVFVSIQLPIGIEKKKKKKMRHVCTTRVLLSFRRLPPSPPPPPSIHWADVFLSFLQTVHIGMCTVPLLDTTTTTTIADTVFSLCVCVWGGRKKAFTSPRSFVRSSQQHLVGNAINTHTHTAASKEKVLNVCQQQHTHTRKKERREPRSERENLSMPRSSHTFPPPPSLPPRSFFFFSFSP